MSTTREPQIIYGWVASATQLATILAPLDKSEFSKNPATDFISHLHDKFSGKLFAKISHDIKHYVFDDLYLFDDDYACFGFMTTELTNVKSDEFVKLMSEFQSVLDSFIKGAGLTQEPSFSTIIFSY